MTDPTLSRRIAEAYVNIGMLLREADEFAAAADAFRQLSRAFQKTPPLTWRSVWH